MDNSVVMIKNGKLKKHTIFTVWTVNGVPQVTKHENCRVITKHFPIAYLHSVKDDNNEVLYERTSNSQKVGEIRICNAFWDESDAIKYRKKLINEEIEHCTERISYFSEKLELLRSHM